MIILGATGFIGRWVARRLSDAGAQVSVTVRDRSTAGEIFDASGIDGEIYELDLCDEKSVQALYRKARPSVTFNLAGYGVDRAEQNEELAYRTNSDLVENICSAISEVRDHDWLGLDIVHVGTAMEYGSAGGNLAEHSVPMPTTLYGRSKLAGTFALADCCDKFGLKGATARLFSVYGPGESPQRLLPGLIAAAATEEPIPLTAGLHKRDFVYVEDVAESLMRLALGPSLSGEVFNVASGNLSTVRKFAETAADILGIRRERLRFGALPTRPEEMSHEPVTVERLRALTGWVPGTTIESGIRKTLQSEMSSSAFKAADRFRPYEEANAAR